MSGWPLIFCTTDPCMNAGGVRNGWSHIKVSQASKCYFPVKLTTVCTPTGSLCCMLKPGSATPSPPTPLRFLCTLCSKQASTPKRVRINATQVFARLGGRHELHGEQPTGEEHHHHYVACCGLPPPTQQTHRALFYPHFTIEFEKVQLKATLPAFAAKTTPRK